MRRLNGPTLAALLAGTMLAGAALAAGTHPVTGEALADDQTFTYRILDEFPSLDPQISEDVTGSEVLRDLFEGLYNQDARGELVPGVALSHEVSDDKLTYTFHLRPEAKWSNGDPVTAGDFVYAWRRLVDPATASPYAWYGELMQLANASAVIAGDMPPDQLGVEAPDAHTLLVHLAAPIPYFPQMTSHTSTFPAPQKAIEQFGADWTRPGNMVSNGAYVLTEHVPGERSVRARNVNYWNDDATIIDRTVALVINDENVALTRFLAGELDRTEVPAGQYPRLKAQYPDVATSFPELCNYYYSFNLSDKGPEAFKDQRVRQALSLAVDRRIIVENVMAGGQPEAYTFTPAATAGFTVPDVPIMHMTQEERDAKAKELMTDAGYGPGNPLKFVVSYNTSPAHEKVAVAVAQMWKQKLGAEVSTANMEWKTFLDERGNGNYEMARGAWCGDYNEASTFLDLMTSTSGYNDAKFANAEVDRLMAEARAADDPQQMYTRVEQIVAEEVPVIPVYHYAGVYMLDTDVGNYPVENVQRNWYSKDLYKKAQ